MPVSRIVLDTNVLVSGLRSRHGASYQILRKLGTDEFTAVISVPLVFEYEAILKRQSRALGLTHQDVDDILDYLCSVGEHHEIFFLWRPVLRDPADDAILELAVESRCHYIVSHNVADFAEAVSFNVKVIRPGEFLRGLQA
jgi:putative PIN family toxin of toxin-antitoxin system